MKNHKSTMKIRGHFLERKVVGHIVDRFKFTKFYFEIDQLLF